MPPAQTTVSLENVLGPGGAVARRLGERYEHRPQQLEMAAAVREALGQGHHLLVEAGTGVGKSFAYLVPAALAAAAAPRDFRVIISTHTINLQEQLVRLKTEALDRFTEGDLEGKELLGAFVTHVQGVYDHLSRLITARRARPVRATS